MKQKRLPVTSRIRPGRAQPQYKEPSLTCYGKLEKLTGSQSAEGGVVDGPFEETFDPVS